MKVVATWCRIDARSRWRSLLVLALLVAFASGTVMASVAGARRGASALDRLLDRTLPATVLVLPNEPGFDWEPVRALPGVEALSNFAVADYAVDEMGDEPGEGIGFPFDAEMTRTVEKPVVLEGRLADPGRVDEVMVTPGFDDRYGVGLGETVTLRLYTPEQVDAAALGDVSGRPRGPAIEATIVGAVRSHWFHEDEGPGLAPSAALLAEYRANLIGSQETGIINAVVRLEDGDAGVEPFLAAVAELAGRSDIEVLRAADSIDHLHDVTGFEARSLLAFALAAAIAALVLVGQAVARYVAASAPDLAVLQAVGLTRGRASAAAASTPVLAAVAGVVLGAVAAAGASRWFPIGTAAGYEPSPGIAVDAAVLAGVAVVVAALVAAGATAAARVALRRTAPRAAPRSAIVTAVLRAGAPAAVGVGTRFALERGRGRQAVPVRSALAGAVLGVLGTVGALTFADGVDDAVTNPERFGLTYELLTFFGFNGDDFAPVYDVLATVGGDGDVAGVNDTRTNPATSAGAIVDIFTFDPVGAPIEVVVTAGRFPSATGEIAMAPRTADAMGVTVGDRIDVKGTVGTETVTITGIAFVPQGPHNDYATGAWATPDTYDALFDGFKYHFALVDLRDDVDPAAFTARLEEENGVLLEPTLPPKEIRELREVQSLPLFLAAFLAVLAIGAVGHALATAVRRRRHDLAALRAIGMTRGQIRAIVLTQAAVFTLLGVAAGVPLGVATGRMLWHSVAEYTPVAYVAPLAVVALAGALVLAPLVGMLLAALPAWRASTMAIGPALRTE